MQENERKEALKKIKEERTPFIKAAAARSIKQKREIKRIKERLAQGPATPPELAQDLGLPPREAMWYLAALRKYGMVSEGAKSGDYFTYELITPEPAAC